MIRLRPSEYDFFTIILVENTYYIARDVSTVGRVSTGIKPFGGGEALSLSGQLLRQPPLLLLVPITPLSATGEGRPRIVYRGRRSREDHSVFSFYFA